MIELSGSVKVKLESNNAYHFSEVDEALDDYDDLPNALDVVELYGFETVSKTALREAVGVDELEAATGLLLTAGGWRKLSYRGRFTRLNEESKDDKHLQEALSPVLGFASQLVVAQSFYQLPSHLIEKRDLVAGFDEDSLPHLAAMIELNGDLSLAKLNRLYVEHCEGCFSPEATSLPVTGITAGFWQDILKVKNDFDQTVQKAIGAGALEHAIDRHHS